MEMGSGTDFAVAKTEPDPISIGFSVTQIVSSSRGRAFARASPADVTVAGFLVKGENTMASSTSKFFVVGSLALVATVAGCDQLGRLVGLAPKREVAQISNTPTTHEPATARQTPRPTPRPTPRTIPPYVEPDSTAAYATPAPWVGPPIWTPAPTQTGGESTAPVIPWLSAKAVEQGDGLAAWDIASGGFGLSREGIDRELVYSRDGGINGEERHTVVAITEIDSHVYWLVYRFWLWYAAGKYESFPDVRGQRAVFRLESISNDGIGSFSFVATKSALSDDVDMGFTCEEDGGSGCGLASFGIRAWALTEAWRLLPATPSPDVVELTNNFARLSGQAEARWGADRITTADLPMPDSRWGPWRPDYGWLFSHGGWTRNKGENTILANPHAVGNNVALAARYSIGSSYDTMEYSVLFRLVKGGMWQRISRPRDEQKAHPYHDMAFSDLYGGPKFFIRVGGFFGTVYTVSEADVTKLR
ncbi:hypothetical protein HY623_04635 [Candidatus Uhrbacteria bacterium]|nr:hypothetical protein [Candidatus Uhrbacteria bacterium]